MMVTQEYDLIDRVFETCDTCNIQLARCNTLGKICDKLPQSWSVRNPTNYKCKIKFLNKGNLKRKKIEVK